MAKGIDTQRTGKIQAAYTTVTATQTTTASYAAVEFDFGGASNKVIDELILGHAISLLVHAYSDTVTTYIKIEGKVNKDYPEWAEIVAETSLSADTDTEVFADVLRYHVIRIMVKQNSGAGDVTIGICAK